LGKRQRGREQGAEGKEIIFYYSPSPTPHEIMSEDGGMGRSVEIFLVIGREFDG